MNAEATEYRDPDEERIEEMLELEEKLLEQHATADIDEDDAWDDTEPQVESEPRGKRAVGTIRSVREIGGGSSLEVEFFVEGGDTETDRIDAPDDLEDADEELVRLSTLCDVEPGRVSDLQGERVPVVWREDEEEYDLHIPSTTNRGGLALYQAWWWTRRQSLIEPDQLTRAAKGGLIAPVAAWAVYGTYIAAAYPVGDTAESSGDEMAHVIPYVEGATIESAGLLLTGVFHILGFIGWGLVLITFFGVLGLLFILTMQVVVRSGQWVMNELWPF